MRSMIWPAAALAVLVLAFVLAYGSVMQTRLGSDFGPAPSRVDESDQ